MTDNGRTKVELEGVAETLLWTLYHRAIEARHPDGALYDPKAVELVARIDFPFEERFGPSNTVMSQILGQYQALRARCFDEEIRRFLADNPKGMIVALGEGLETQFWRIGGDQVDRVRWVTVDLPHVVELRQRLLPPESDRQRLLACSAVDRHWMDEVDAADGLLVTAQGLLMYLQPAQVHQLIARCARRFPGGALLFDGVSRWFSRQTMSGRLRAQGYRLPPMPWPVDSAERARIRSTPGVHELRDLRPPPGRGQYRYLWKLMDLLLPRDFDPRLQIVVAQFGSRDAV